jgi:signal transduction histidine kinase
VLWALVTGAVIHALGWVVRLDDDGRPVLVGAWIKSDVELTNRFAVPAIADVWQVGVAVGLIASGLAIVSFGLRFRRSSGEERAQLRWLALVGYAIVFLFLLMLIVGIATGTTGDSSESAGSDLAFLPLLFAIILGIPIACAIAILKYHLYDIDVVIRKTVVVGLLAVFITVVYAAIVAVVSRLFQGSDAGSFLAAATLAVLFAPARDRARKIADRLVYGKRATPYEVLAEFSDRVGGAYAADDVLHRMAQVLEEGTGAAGARVLLRVGTELREAASIGERGEETMVAVTHQGEELGALAVTMPASDPMNPAKLQLVEDLAAQAGLVLRNVKLIEELKASRQRLVAAQDEERRKIERNIHDGAQQQLVALAVQLKLASGMVGKDEDRERDLLAKLVDQTNEALEDLRDLARGIYPPLLQDKGLPAALEAQARKAVVPTTVTADGLGRFDQATESAVYFSCLEALQNVAKYAEASRATITLSNGDGHLRFSVTDDGQGFDASATSYGTGLQGIADRLAAIGGILTVTSTPGHGTTIDGRVPV